MKKLSLVSLITFCMLVLGIQSTTAQVINRTNLSTSNVYLATGNIEGSIQIKKSDIPNTTNINQIALVVKNGLKAFEFDPQNNGLLADQYIHVAKGHLVNATTVVSVKSTTDTYVIDYAIQQVPLMKPMMVKLIGDAAKTIRFAVDPILKNFPVAYLTTCDRTFECYNFRGVFIPIIK